MRSQPWIILLLVALGGIPQGGDPQARAQDIGSGEQMWMEFDGLVWWTKANRIPELVTASGLTNPMGAPTTLAESGVLGRPQTSVLSPNSLEMGARLGGRLKAGYWIDGDDLAVEGSFLSLGEADKGDFYADSSGNPILARPFTNLTLGMEDSVKLAYPALFSGAVSIESSSEFHSGEIMLRKNYYRATGGRLDLLGGYRYVRFRDSLAINSLVVNSATNPLNPGTSFGVVDRFLAENDLHAGQLGFVALFERDRFSVELCGKVAMGTIKQTVDVRGTTTITSPAAPGNPAVANGGLLALPTNSGSRSSNQFAFLPELSLNVKYHVNDAFSFTFGYTLLYLTDVVRSGDQIDLGINTTQLPQSLVPFSGVSRPGLPFQDSAFWAQGINVGGQILF